MQSDDRYESTWHLFLNELERNPKARLAPFLVSHHVYQRGFQRWMSRHGYSVGEAKGRVLQLRIDKQATVGSADVPGFLPVELGGDTGRPQPDLLTGVSLTLPDGTVVSIRRGSAGAVVSFLKLYSGEGQPCSD
jgi:hypothetical protein